MTPLSRAPLEDFSFVLNDYLALAQYGNLPGFADAGADTVEAILAEAGRIAEKVLLPLNEPGDREGCTYDAKSKTVATPAGFKAAYKTFAEGGWTALAADPDFGGQGLPSLVGTAVSKIFCAAN